MDRRDFFRGLLAASVLSSFRLEAKTAFSPTTLYLLSDSPERFLPAILRDVSSRLRLTGQTFSIDDSHPASDRLSRGLRGLGWRHLPGLSRPATRLTFQALAAPAFPSFTLIQEGKILDIRSRSLFSLWKEMNVDGSPASLLTIASFSDRSPSLRLGHRVAVYADGCRVATFSLHQDRVEKIQTRSGQVRLAIESGQARVVASTCRHQICLRTPPITQPGERIVCAPRHFLLEVEGPRLVDTVTG